MDDDEDEKPPWLTEEEFQQKYRINRTSFWKIVELIKDHQVFNPKQAPVPHQLLVFLHYIGTSGSGANNPRVSKIFGIGRGTAELYRNRVAMAIRCLRATAIKWPDEDERKALATRIRNKYNLPNCILVADGTLLPLMQEPQSEDGPDYLAGFPGCSHDSRVYNHTKIARTPQDFFGDKYYLVADSAMENSSSCVASFKAPRGHQLPVDHEKFNTCLGRYRVTSEHTIGIWKGRFPWLRCIPMVITDDKRSVKKILKYIDCCVILHNLLIKWKDEPPEEYFDNEEIDDDFDDMLSATLQLNASNDERRQRLLEYLKEYQF